MTDSYRTVAAHTTTEAPRVRGSRFIADAFPVATERVAAARLAEVRQREPNATHHCWSYRLSPAGDQFRYSDDGEPTGTAGAPILRQIEGRDLAHTLVVVTRYYGGTKLGTGGLVRAYGDAAAAVLEVAEIVVRVQRQRVRLRFAYDDTSPAMQTLHRFEAEVVSQDYGADTALTVLVRQRDAHALLEAFTNALGGRGEAGILDG